MPEIAAQQQMLLTEQQKKCLRKQTIFENMPNEMTKPNLTIFPSIIFQILISQKLIKFHFVNKINKIRKGFHHMG